MYLQKSAFIQKIAHSFGKKRLSLKNQLVAIRTQINPAIIHTVINSGTSYGSLLFGSGNILALYGKSSSYGLNLDFGWEYFNAAHFYIFAFMRHTDYRYYGIGGNLTECGQKIRMFIFFYSYLNPARNVLQNYKAHRFTITEIFDKALNQNAFFQIITNVLYIYSLHMNLLLVQLSSLLLSHIIH